jgi:hypothetical protein
LQSEDEGQGVIGDLVRAVLGNIGDPDSSIGRRCHVDGIHADPEPGNDAAACRPVDGGSIETGKVGDNGVCFGEKLGPASFGTDDQPRSRVFHDVPDVCVVPSNRVCQKNRHNRHRSLRHSSGFQLHYGP